MELDSNDEGEDNLLEFIPIKNLWEQHSKNNSKKTLELALNFFKDLPVLIGTGPSAIAVINLENSELIAKKGAFKKVMGVSFKKNMSLNTLNPLIYPPHNPFMIKYFTIYLQQLLKRDIEERKQVEFSSIFKIRRVKRYYWINYRVVKIFTDHITRLGYAIMEWTDISNVKSDSNAKIIVYDNTKGYLINEICCADTSLFKELTPAEISITMMITKGRSDKEIANTKKIAIGTVKQHKKHIFSKLGINKSIELVALAYGSDLVS